MATRTRTARRPARAILALISALLLLLAARPGTAMAHASLLRSSPSQDMVLAHGPGTLQLWFSESIDLPNRPLIVYAPDGKVLATGKPEVAADDSSEMVATLRTSAPGSYLVRWKVISADTHPVSGSFTFSVGAPSPIVNAGAGSSAAYTASVLAAQAAGRWLTLLGGSLVVGAAVLWWWVLDRQTESLEPPRRDSYRGLLRLMGRGGLLVAIGVPVTLIAQMAALSDSWGEALSIGSFNQAFDVKLGGVCSLRLAAAVGIYIIGSVLLYLGPPPPSAARRRLPPALLRAQIALGLVPLLSSALIGHALSTDPAWLSVGLDWLHLAAMGVWLGGVVSLALVLPRLLGASPKPRPSPSATAADRPLSTDEAAGRGDQDPRAELVSLRWRVLAGVLPRFSALAIGSMAVLAATGTYSALRNVGSLDQLVSTDYGRALLVKLGLLSLVLAVAAINLLVLGPALRRVAAGGTPRVADLWPILRPLLRLEALLLAALLAAVGVLTAVAPARQAAAQPTVAQIPITLQSVVDSGPHAVLAGHAGYTLVTMALAPVAQGRSTIAVGLADPENNGVAADVSLRLVPPARSGLPAVEATLAPQGAGRYATTADLGAVGKWELRLAVALRGEQATVLGFGLQLPIRPGAALLVRMDRALNRLRSLQMEQLVTAGQPPVPFTWTYAAPDREHYRSGGRVESIRIGLDSYLRQPDGRWSGGRADRGQGFAWPDYSYARQGTDATTVGHEAVGGVPCTVVSYWLPYPNVAGRWWIDERSGRPLRAEQMSPGHFEYDRFTNFDSAPPIVPPAGRLP